MHRIHHQRDRHTNNYGYIVWWDMLFGTYENPACFTQSCGFSEENEQRQNQADEQGEGAEIEQRGVIESGALRARADRRAVLKLVFQISAPVTAS